jgi:hypothetical protein
VELVSDGGPSNRLGRYHLMEPIGGGPCGEVFRAKVYGVAGLERQFAVKRLFPAVVAAAKVPGQLSTAARAYGSLDHPRIARLAEFGVSSGVTFTATEMAPGLDLARLAADSQLAGRPILPGSALALVAQAARAVGYAHGRGISHLGVAPTNLIISADGDVKITDVGILHATLPDRPGHDRRFAVRVQYLAPEQLTGEATSAATDVFALGVIAYELVCGQRVFQGATQEDVAQAVIAGQVPTVDLPRPLLRVLQRCVARSPFERFPDARAFADALDAALRVSPVAGTRREIGDVVASALERLAVLQDSAASGAIALNLPAQLGLAPEPGRGGEPAPAHTLLGVAAIPPPSTFSPGGVAQPPVPAPAAAAPKPFRAPAVIPVIPARPGDPRPATDPSGTAPAAAPLAAPPAPLAVPPALTPPVPLAAPVSLAPLTGGSATPPAPLPPPAAPPPPPLRAPSPALTPPGAPGRAPSGAATLIGAPMVIPSVVGSPPRVSREVRRDPPPSADIPSVDGAVAQASETLDLEPLPPVMSLPAAPTQPTVVQGPPQGPALSPTLAPPPTFAPPPGQGHAPGQGYPPGPGQGYPPGPGQGYPPGPGPGYPPGPPGHFGASMLGAQPRRSRLLWPLIGLVVVGGAAGAGWWWSQRGPSAPATTGPVAGGDAGPRVAVGADAGVAVVTAGEDAGRPGGSDAASAVVSVADAAPTVASVADAAPAVASAADAAPAVAAGNPPDPVPDRPTGASTGPDGDLILDSTPSRIRVFLDGADVGKTPLTLPGSADRHSLAMAAPGHELYLAEVDGRGKFAITLREVAPAEGPAGIKVRCKQKDRYYVFLDGKPTGQLCPSERLGVELGPHVVEIHDLVTETRRQFPVTVKETRNSLRVRVD